MALRLAKLLQSSFHPVHGFRGLRTVRFSSESSNDDNCDDSPTEEIGSFEDVLRERRSSQAQAVDPKKGWAFRGVHRAIICGKVGQNPVQKILRSGRIITIFNVGTGGMLDQRTISDPTLPRKPQWHRIVVHNEVIGRYVVQQLTKSSSVYVEGDIEARVYNDMNGEVRTVPEICVRRDGRIRLIKSGEGINNAMFEDLRNDLFGKNKIQTETSMEP